MEVTEVPEPPCPDKGLLLKVETCSICASDLKMFRQGHRDLRYPRILGHEVVGRIVEDRSEGEWSIGERVQIWPGDACGQCRCCGKGLDNLCPQVRILGFSLDGGFAEFMAVPEGCVARGGVNLVPSSMASETASLAEPLACCVNAQHSLNLGEGDEVLIIGGGPLGALHAMLARHREAEKVIIIEKEEQRRRKLPATKADLILASEEDWESVIISETQGRGVDAIIMATSDVAIDSHLIDLLAPRGRICVFSGLPKASSLASLDLNRLHYAEKIILGSYGCRSQDCREALGMLARGDLEVEWLLTARIRLESIIEGLEVTASRKGMKVTVTNF
ncbi:MAG: alcohol dehydrogenase catalytic domain-containing protein [Methanomassiliicoccales archaeon]